MNKKECKLIFKILVIGYSISGKKELLYLLINQFFPGNSNNIGADIVKVTIKINCNDIKLNLISPDGMERFRSLTHSYIKNNDAIIFLFNVTDESSYNRISNFYSQTKEYNKAVPTMIIGNFAEDSEHRVVHRAQVKKLAEDNGDLYFELLNSYDRNIYVYLEILTRRILETKGIVLRKPNNAYSIILTKTKEQKQKNNCI